MRKDFRQIAWDEPLQEDLRDLLRLAVREDLADAGDCTTLALVPEGARGRAAVVARQAGVVAGLPAAAMALAQIDPRAHWRPQAEDGQTVGSGQCLARIEGPVHGILAAERLLLNLLGHLSGIATLARQYVEAVTGTKARIFDTRKTLPGWRRLEKYAVRCGGAWNHRTGLFEAILIKDNHLAWGSEADATSGGAYRAAEAVRRARQYVATHLPEPDASRMILEVEVDTLDQLEQVLPEGPDIVLLDNMLPPQLREAVRRRDRLAPAVELEASGGVSLETVRAIAESGVDRISVGALTHSAASLDLGLDWLGPCG